MNISKHKSIETILMLIVCFATIIVLAKQFPIGSSSIPQMPESVSDGWYYMKDNQKIEVTLPTTIHDYNESTLVLYNDSLSKDWASVSLTTRGAVYDLKISLGDNVLYEYDDTSFPRNIPMSSKVNCTATLPSDYNGEKIAFTFYNTENNTYKIPEIYAGHYDSILIYYLSKDFFSFLSVLIMLILAIITISAYLYSKYKGLNERRFADIAFFLLFCGCWFLTDSSTVQTFSGSSPMIRYVSFYAFMMLALPMLHFVKNTGNMSSYRQINYFIYAFYINIVAQSILNYIGVFDFIDMLFITHLLLASGVISLVILLQKEYKKENNKEILSILHSFAALGSGGVLALILYWVLQISYYEVFFDFGIILFIALLIRSLIITAVDNFLFRTEMLVYQRLAKEDNLTGLKNRRAFDELIEEISNQTGTYKDIFLIFMDLNHLKDINDHFGHGTGDEILIGAARCIERTFQPNGHCFRIGGDEFCVILINPDLSKEEINIHLDQAIDQYNKTMNLGRFQLSIARGISSIRDDDGNIKSIGDWKREADLNMYKNKGWVRR